LLSCDVIPFDVLLLASLHWWRLMEAKGGCDPPFVSVTVGLTKPRVQDHLQRFVASSKPAIDSVAMAGDGWSSAVQQAAGSGGAVAGASSSVGSEFCLESSTGACWLRHGCAPHRSSPLLMQ
jgi:hypothetical protein